MGAVESLFGVPDREGLYVVYTWDSVVVFARNLPPLGDHSMTEMRTYTSDEYGIAKRRANGDISDVYAANNRGLGIQQFVIAVDQFKYLGSTQPKTEHQ